MAGQFPTAEQIRASQLGSLNELLARIIPANPFYTRKIQGSAIPTAFARLEDFQLQFPFTTKAEIVRDQEECPPYGRNLTYPLERYTRLNQTSGTSGKPLRWLDTAESWSALTDCWQEVHRAAGVTAHDSIYFAFSFGPFLGFWLAFEAAARIGCLCIPGGGLSSVARLKAILDLNATVLCCTPTYAIHLGSAAVVEGIDLSMSKVRLIMVAGEPGGSLPATRAHIERVWPGARVFDHHGMTEVGPVTYECPARPCRLHVIESGYFAEVIDPKTNQAVPAATRGELVLTTLTREGSPLVRYRTGDLVEIGVRKPCECGRFETAFEGGILGRTDDMVVVRGVNIYPTAIEEIIRQFPAIEEYQVHITEKAAMTEMSINVELAPAASNVIEALGKALQMAFNLRIPVRRVAEKTLPRAELKARRWIRD